MKPDKVRCEEQHRRHSDAQVGATRYQAVICDMFDTLVNFHWDQLPLVAFEGGMVRSTSPLLYEALHPLFPAVAKPEFCRAFIESSREAERMRADTLREVTAHARFRIFLRRLGISDGAAADTVIEIAIREQMRRIRGAMEFPEENRAALDALRSKYRMAVLSNFDYGPTVEAALADFGIRDRFEVVVVSADVGWRKPHPEIFRETLRRMGLEPAHAVFVGDTPDADVLGPQSVGMDVIWIDRSQGALPPGAAAPLFSVPSFAAAATLL